LRDPRQRRGSGSSILRINPKPLALFASCLIDLPNSCPKLPLNSCHGRLFGVRDATVVGTDARNKREFKLKRQMLRYEARGKI